MRLIRFPITIFIVLFLLACATVPTPEQISEADYGSYPDNYQEIVKAYYSQRLFDPYSAHYRWIKPPSKGYFSEFGQFKFGYIVFVGINAKNRMGGYVGEQQESILIKNDRVIKIVPLSKVRN